MCFTDDNVSMHPLSYSTCRWNCQHSNIPTRKVNNPDTGKDWERRARNRKEWAWWSTVDDYGAGWSTVDDDGAGGMILKTCQNRLQRMREWCEGNRVERRNKTKQLSNQTNINAWSKVTLVERAILSIYKSFNHFSRTNFVCEAASSFPILHVRKGRVRSTNCILYFCTVYCGRTCFLLYSYLVLWKVFSILM